MSDGPRATETQEPSSKLKLKPHNEDGDLTAAV